MSTLACEAPATSQCDRILAVLADREGQWVTMPELSDAGANTPGGFCIVHSRISDLRQRGHQIEHKRETIDGRCHSFYMLVPHPVADEVTSL